MKNVRTKKIFIFIVIIVAIVTYHLMNEPVESDPVDPETAVEVGARRAGRELLRSIIRAF